MTQVSTLAQRAREVLRDRYPTLSLMHEGRCGLVFLATPAGTFTIPVVVKVAYPAGVGPAGSTLLARFRREAEIGARLSHPRILRNAPPETIHDVEFYEMPQAGPMRLDHLITAPNPPQFARILTMLQELADALDYAHAHGVVHGALRPSAVLLDMAGGVLLKGFCLEISDDPPVPPLTPAAVGDPAYMAPEQWHDQKVDRSLDVYALGVLAYELCTGSARVGYDAQGVPEIRPIELAPNHPLRADVPIHVTAAIRRALNRDPAMRFPTAGRFVRALTEPDEALGATLPTIKPPVHRRRHSPWMLIVLVLIVAVTLASVVPSPLREWLASVVRAIMA